MTIKKLGHCCLIIKTGTVTILTDPGSYTTSQNDVMGVDIVLITHEHQDHFHIDSVRKIMANNPNAKIITNPTVGKLLQAENIAFEPVIEGTKNDLHGAVIEGYGHKHAVVYGELGQTENTGFMIDGKIFYPGDAFTNPGRPVDILALPVGGPWMKISECIEYALLVKPRTSFPVHDAMFNLGSTGFMHKMIEGVLGQQNIGFMPMKTEDEREF